MNPGEKHIFWSQSLEHTVKSWPLGLKKSRKVSKSLVLHPHFLDPISALDHIHHIFISTCDISEVPCTYIQQAHSLIDVLSC